MKKFIALVTFVLLMGLSVMVVHAEIGNPIPHDTRWVTAESLNVRWEPNMGAGIITQIYQFERVIIDRIFGSGDLAWFRIRLVCNVDYVSGWVFGGWLGHVNEFIPPPPIRTATPTPTAPAAPAAPVVPVAPAPPTPPAADSVMRVTAGMLNVRWEPNMQAGIIRAIPLDTWVVVNPHDPARVHGSGDLAWFYVRLVDGDLSGWVFNAFLSPW